MFSAVIIRVSTDKMHLTTMSRTAIADSSVPRSAKWSSFKTSQTSGGSVVGPNRTGEGVQIALETVTHRDPRETYEMNKVSDTSSQPEVDQYHDKSVLV